MSALQTVALFGACCKRLTALIGIVGFFVLYVILADLTLRSRQPQLFVHDLSSFQGGSKLHSM